MARIDARRVDALECVASVLLAILFAHLLGARNISWAAFSGFMVMRGHAAESLMRGVLRIIGTGMGGALALGIVPVAASSPAGSAIAIVAVGLPTLYAALTAKRAYAWLFVGLTFAMVLFDAMDAPARPIPPIVETRMLEVVAGTLACAIVSIASTLTLRRRWPAVRAGAARGLGWDRHAFRHACQGAVALAILPFIGHAFAVPELAQGAVTIMAVMLVPVAGLGDSGFWPVTRRLGYRVAGCLAGAGFSAIVLLIARGDAVTLILGTIAGVASGRMIENGGRASAYMGTQYVLAVLVVLVPDSYADAAIAPGLARLTGIVVGMAVLEPVLIAWHIGSPRRRGAITPRAEPGDV